MTITRKTRVLVVDDSAVMQALITRMLSAVPDVEVIGTASDAFEARAKLVALSPDVMTLDIDMPRLNGIAFLEKVMKYFPTPTVVVSARAIKGSEIEKQALAAGAIQAVEKPKIQSGRSLQDASSEILAAVALAAKVRFSGGQQGAVTSPVAQVAAPRSLSTAAFANASASGFAATSRLHAGVSEAVLARRIVAIASSTGGTEALKTVLCQLPAEVPPIVVVQHMPPLFTSQFTQHLREICAFQVREAQDGDLVTPGHLFLAPGDFHMEVEKSGPLRIRLHRAPMLHGVRPAADYLFESVARTMGKHSLGVILTGMGKDGAQGLLSMKKAGGSSIVQDEKTSVVFGMPKAAIDVGAADQVVPLTSISGKILEWIQAQGRTSIAS
ncbi:MAG: protein-glutamate methylesterase [Pseudomonadota bacterium]|jgi:two-component system chemotaxis response regulator CheB